MTQKDVMKDWFRELPTEHPSPDFTVKVMQRVMSEWSLNPNKYQPIISKKGWWTIAAITLLLTAILFILHSFLPAATTTPVPGDSILGVDYSRILAPVNQLFVKLNNLSPAVLIGTMAIIALWFFDQLFVKTVKR